MERRDAYRRGEVCCGCITMHYTPEHVQEAPQPISFRSLPHPYYQTTSKSTAYSAMGTYQHVAPDIYHLCPDIVEASKHERVQQSVSKLPPNRFESSFPQRLLLLTPYPQQLLLGNPNLLHNTSTQNLPKRHRSLVVPQHPALARRFRLQF